MLRHYSSAYRFYGAVPGAQLVVRMISTVYNYDYIQDMRLDIDGTIEVKVVTSGYAQATTYRPFYPRHYGFPLFTNASGERQTWRVFPNKLAAALQMHAGQQGFVMVDNLQLAACLELLCKAYTNELGSQHCKMAASCHKQSVLTTPLFWEALCGCSATNWQLWVRQVEFHVPLLLTF